jgi:hypothetical protein
VLTATYLHFLRPTETKSEASHHQQLFRSL